MVKETDEFAWSIASLPEQQTQGVMLNDVEATIPERNYQSQKNS